MRDSFSRFFILVILVSCSSKEEAAYKELRKQNRTFARVERSSGDRDWLFEESEEIELEPYSWEAEKE
jgi:hypothetical protein